MSLRSDALNFDLHQTRNGPPLLIDLICLKGSLEGTSDVLTMHHLQGGGGFGSGPADLRAGVLVEPVWACESLIVNTVCRTPAVNCFHLRRPVRAR